MAEPDSEQPTTTTEPRSSLLTAPPPSLDEALGWVGFKVDELNGPSVGRVADVYLDARDGTPVWLVIRLGRFGQQTAIPYEHVAPGAGHVWIPYERVELRGAPRIDAGKPLTRDDELQMLSHFGFSAEAGRQAALLALAQGTVTSTPARGNAQEAEPAEPDPSPAAPPAQGRDEEPMPQLAQARDEVPQTDAQGVPAVGTEPVGSGGEAEQPTVIVDRKAEKARQKAEKVAQRQAIAVERKAAAQDRKAEKARIRAERIAERRARVEARKASKKKSE